MPWVPARARALFIFRFCPIIAIMQNDVFGALKDFEKITVKSALDLVKRFEEAGRQAIELSVTAEGLRSVRFKYLGRKTGITEFLKSLKNRPLSDRRILGPAVTETRGRLQDLFRAQAERIAARDRVAADRRLDLTKPGRQVFHGHLHPLSIVERQVREIFTSLNFSVVEGPEVETEYYNFDALNIPAHHPARDNWDTFWIRAGGRTKDAGQGLLLRTHTSPVQIRYMERHKPPLRIVVPGRVFRYEASDFSHEINFYQVEGLMVSAGVDLSAFKYIIEEFFKKLFQGQKIEFRLRPSFFPFTEPSVELDIKLKGKWLEVMGAGMVNQNVFRHVGYEPGKHQGFAFGFGLERVAMIKYQIPDIRLFYGGDPRFVKKF